MAGALLAIAAAAAGLGPAAGGKQDRFVISFWVDPIVPVSRFDLEYQRIAAANFSVLLGGFGATNTSAVKAQIDAASRAGLAAIPSSCSGGCIDLPGAWGYQIWDEPRVSDFRAVAKVVAKVKDSQNIAFVNLLPNYASADEMGAANYGEYVRQFVETVKPNVLSVDHYPDFDQPKPGRYSNKSKAGYVANLLVLREASLAIEPPIPFWNFFNAMPYNAISQYDISEAELRWQVFTSLALGSKGVMYFCYWTPPGGDFLRGQAIMTPSPGSTPDIANQSPSHKYSTAARINSKLRTFGEWLLHRTSSAVLQVTVNDSDVVFLNVKLAVWNNISGTAEGPESQFLLGFFDNNRTVLLSNQDSNHPALATVGMATSSTMREVDPRTGELHSARDDSPFLPGFQIALVAGDARLFTWKLDYDYTPTSIERSRQYETNRSSNSLEHDM